MARQSETWEPGLLDEHRVRTDDGLVHEKMGYVSWFCWEQYTNVGSPQHQKLRRTAVEPITCLRCLGDRRRELRMMGGMT